VFLGFITHCYGITTPHVSQCKAKVLRQAKVPTDEKIKPGSSRTRRYAWIREQHHTAVRTGPVVATARGGTTMIRPDDPDCAGPYCWPTGPAEAAIERVNESPQPARKPFAFGASSGRMTVIFRTSLAQRTGCDKGRRNCQEGWDGDHPGAAAALAASRITLCVGTAPGGAHMFALEASKRTSLMDGSQGRCLHRRSSVSCRMRERQRWKCWFDDHDRSVK
jgi:hypothetical protein